MRCHHGLQLAKGSQDSPCAKGSASKLIHVVVSWPQLLAGYCTEGLSASQHHMDLSKGPTAIWQLTFTRGSIEKRERIQDRSSNIIFRIMFDQFCHILFFRRESILKVLPKATNARRQGLLGAILKPTHQRWPVSLQFGELEPVSGTHQWKQFSGLL